MPGSIKIDDGSGNYTILTNAGSLGSDKTITVPNETATLATTTATDLGHMVKLATVTASNTAEIDFNSGVTGFNSTTYRSFCVRGKWITPATDTARLYVNLADGTTKRTGTYETGVYQTRIEASHSGYHQQDLSGALDMGVIQLGNSTRETYSFEVCVFPSGDSGSNHAGATVGYYHTVGKVHNATSWYFPGGFQYDSTSYMDGIYFSMSTGNIATGVFDFYGVK